MSHSWTLAIDPGKATGIALGTYGRATPWRRVGIWQVRNGAAGLRDWLMARLTQDGNWKFEQRVIPLDELPLIVEKFTPLQHQNFNLTQESIEPVRCEGVLTAFNLDRFIHWQRPEQMYFMGGESPLKRKQAATAFLRKHDLYRTGVQVGHTDANDVHSATMHTIAYMRHLRHEPTLRHYFGGP